MPDLHTIRLKGEAAHGDRISGHLFRDLFSVLVDGAERAVRFNIDGQSSAPGPTPKWLRPASDFVLVRRPDLDASTFVIEGKPLREALPDRFPLGDKVEEFDPGRSAIDLFEDALEDAIAGNDDSTRFDPGLAGVCARFGELLRQGIEEVEILNGRTVRVDQLALTRFETLSARAYPKQRVRVAGRLEAIRYSDCRFTLTLDDGTRLSGTAAGPGQTTLQAQFGKPVVVTGSAVFRPSGKPLRVEADSIEESSEVQMKLWSSLPKPLRAPFEVRQLRPHGGARGIDRLLGTWPGDESEEEINVMLASVS